MKEIAGNLLRFIRQTNKRDLVLIGSILILLVSLNYTYGLESRLIRIPSFITRFVLSYLLYLVVFSGSMLIVMNNDSSVKLLENKFLLLLLLIAPAIFAWKWSSGLLLPVSDGVLSRFVAITLNPILKCGVLFAILYWLGKTGRYHHRLDGLKFRNVNLAPFVVSVILFTPVIFYFASTPSFQETYPRLQRVKFMMDTVSQPWITAAIFELSYAFDFVFVEVFFRGFLILAFARYGGEKVILPMAALYCAIHFGKPLAECISSFFGGILLGVIAYHSRSVAGGLILHLGIGWLMEIAGLIWSK